MKRLVAICLFAALLWAAGQMSTWGQGKSVNRGPSAETSRRGFQPIEYSGPLTYPEMVRLLLRREGDFRLPVTRAFVVGVGARHAYAILEMVHERGYFASNFHKQEVIELFQRGRDYFEKVAAMGTEF